MIEKENQNLANAWHQYYATFVVNLIMLGQGCIIGFIAPAFPRLTSKDTPLLSGPLTNEQVSWIGSVNCIGSLVGSMAFGYIVGIVGCKRATLFLAVPSTAHWLLIYFGNHYYHILFARFCGGWVTGGSGSTIFLYVSEISNNDIRGRLSSVALFVRNIGVLIAYILGATVDYSYIPCISVMIPIVFAITFSALPNTPQYHLHKEKPQKAEKSLKYYKGYKGNDKHEDKRFEYEFERLKSIAIKRKTDEKLRLADFWNPGALKGLGTCVVLVILSNCTANFPLISYSVIFDTEPFFLDAQNSTVEGFIVNLKCEGLIEFLEKEYQPIAFNDKNLWLFIDLDIESGVNAAIGFYKSKLNQLNPLPISDLFIAKRFQHNSIQWLFFELCRVDNDFDVDVIPNGFINLEKNDTLRFIGADLVASRRKNLKGLNVACGLVIAYPEKFTYVDDPATNHIDVFTKAYMKFSENLREDLNMSCQVIQVDSYGWLTNGTFNGLMGLFQKKKIRMTLHGINMRPERLMFSEFAGNFFTPRTPLIFREPALSTVANIYILPLDLDVWRSTFILMIVIIFVMAIELLHPLLRTSMDWSDVVTFILGAFCQQSTHLQIPTVSGRVIVLTTFLATLAIFTSYAASIVALLQSPSHYIKTLDDLIASPMKVGIHEAGYTHFYVKSNFSGIVELYKKKIEPQGESGWIYDPFVGVERVRTQLFAFLIDSQSAYKAIHKTFTDVEKCGIKEFQIIVLPISTIAVERNSGYKEIVKQRIAWQKEVGLIKREEIRWIPNKPSCSNGNRGFIQVNMNVIEPAITLLLFGYVLSISIALLEWLIAKCKKIFARNR